MMKRIVIFLILLLPAPGVYAGNHPELRWRTFEGEHFIVHFHNGTEQTAHQAYLIAESVYEPIAKVYDYYPPDKTHIIVRDHDDVANGASYTHGGKIEIWATSLNMEYRGTHQWLKNVFAHEFTHTVSRQAALRLPSWLYAFTFQGSRNYSNPDIRVTLPYATDVIPQWFSEGMAQFEDDKIGYESYDTHHNMLLRMAFLDSMELDYVQMGIFEKGSTGSELVYNQGYSLVAFIAETFGRDQVSALVDHSADNWGFSFDKSIEGVLGITADSLYDLWHAHYADEYAGVKAGLEAEGLVEGDSLYDRGFSDFYGTWSPDGRKLAVVSAGGPYLIYNLFLVDPDDEEYEDGTAKFIKGGMSSLVGWAPDGKSLYYSRMERTDKDSYFNDLFRYGLEDEEEEQLTHGLRASWPSVSPDGTEIAFVHNTDGTQRVGVLTMATDSIRYLTPAAFGHQYYHPRWSPDGTRLAVCAFTGCDRDIMVMDAADGGNAFRAVATAADERDPYWSADGTALYYVSDRTGIFNVYRSDLAGTTAVRLTNVLGGTFNPSVSGDTLLAFSSFSGNGFRLNRLDSLAGPTFRLERKSEFITDQLVDGIGMEDFLERSHGYSFTTPTLNFFPNVTWNDDVFKLGCEFYGVDVLDQQALEGGIAAGQDGDMDIELHYELNKFRPTLFADFFYLRRNYPEAAKLRQYSYDFTNYFYPGTDGIINGNVSYRFDLYQTNAGLRKLLTDTQIAYLFYTYKDFKYSVTVQVPGVLKEQFSSVTYLSGHNLNLVWARGSFAPSPDVYINPRGSQTVVSYALCADATWDTLQKEGTSRFDTTVYNRFDVYHQWAYSLPWLGHVADLELSAGLIDKQVHSYFSYNINFLIGGHGSVRSLPFYSLEGNRKLTGRLTYRFPIMRSINKRFLGTDLVRLYGGVFFEAGNAWNGGDFDYTGWKQWNPRLNELKKGAGLELRMDGVSFYSYPMKVYFSVAGLLDRLPQDEDERVYKDDDDQDRVRYYFGIGFSY